MKYIIVGNGVAGVTAAESIRRCDGDGDITIITDESYPFYSRIRLIDFLAGNLDIDSLILKSENWYGENNIGLIVGAHVSDIDHGTNTVITSSGETLPYDHLLLATGGVSFVPPITGVDREGVFTLRTLQDAISILEHVERGDNRIVLIGGGVLGLEAGNSLRKRGNAITVVEFFPRLLPRQLDDDGAEILKAQMERMGFTFYLDSRAREIVGEESVQGIILEDGREIDCDTIIISAGIKPGDSLPRKMGLKIERGVVVNDRMETEIPNIYAAGDLIQHRGVFYGIWSAAERQGEVAGMNMAGGNEYYEGTTISNTLKVMGIDLFAVGDIDAEGKYVSIAVKDKNTFTYRKLVIQDGIIRGAILYGNVEGRGKIMKAIEKETDITNIMKELEKWNLDSL
jgi:nitrite reductase (NADH) large subunit